MTELTTDTAKAGAIIGFFVGIMFWVIIWIVIAGPALIIYLVSSSTRRESSYANISTETIQPSSLLSDTKICPTCAEEIKLAAINCKHCGETFDEGQVTRQVADRHAQVVPTTPTSNKRPKILWVISIFYLLSLKYNLLSFVLIYSGSIPLNEAQQSYFSSQTFIDILFSISIILLNFIGTIYLLLLKRYAFYAFLYAFVISFILTGYYIIFKDLIVDLGSSGIIGAIIGFTINIAIILYTKGLINKRILK